jgi:hypothetical protein
VDLRAGLDDLEKRQFLTLPGLELRPARRSSLYRLSYPGSPIRLGSASKFHFITQIKHSCILDIIIIVHSEDIKIYTLRVNFRGSER